MHKRLRQDQHIALQNQHLAAKNVAAAAAPHVLTHKPRSVIPPLASSAAVVSPPFATATPAIITPLFTRVTARSTARLTELADQTETNLTINTRSVNDYNKLLQEDIILEIIHAHQNHGPVTILDAGCGKAVAMNLLLRGKFTGPLIKEITGISKDHFRGIEEVIREHAGKFVYYNGKVENVLAQKQISVKIIFDVWGAFTYSLEKMLLLQQYYDALELGGTAYIYIGISIAGSNEQDRVPYIIFSDCDVQQYPNGKNMVFELATRFPNHFGRSKHTKLIMHKCTPDFPIRGGFEYRHAGLVATIKNMGVLPLEDLIAGNAVKQNKVVITHVLRPRSPSF